MPDPQTIAALLKSVRPAPPIDSSMAGSPAYQASSAAGPSGGASGSPAPLSNPAVASIIASMVPQDGRPALAGNLRGLPPTSPFDIASIVRQVSQLPEYQKPVSSLEDIGSRERAVEQELTNMPVPKMGFSPTWAGDMAKRGTPSKHPFLHNLGQALLTVAASTRPGQAVQEQIYGPGIRSYEEKKSLLAERLKALRGEETVPTEELHGLTGLANTAGMGMYRGGQLQLGEERNETARRNSDTRALQVANTHTDTLQKISQGWDRLSIEQQKAQAQQWYQKALIDTMRERTAAGMDENSARIQSTQDLRTAMSQNQWVMTHPWMNFFGLAPDLVSPPAAQTPKTVGTPTPPTSKPNNKKRVVDLTK